MITFNMDFLNQKEIFNQEELRLLNHDIGLIEFDRENKKSLFYKFYFDFIFASAKIEGNTYTKIEADTLLETNKTALNKPIDDAMQILNIKKAYDFIIDFKPEINKRTFKEIHQILSEGLLPRDAQGLVRNIPVTIGGSDYIPLTIPDQLEITLDKILENYHSIKGAFDRAVYLHNNVAYLQYFQDCNKRLARILQNLSLLKDDRLPLAFLGSDNIVFNDYKRALIEYYETGSHEGYKSFFIQEYNKELEIIKYFNLKPENKKTSKLRLK